MTKTKADSTYIYSVLQTSPTYLPTYLPTSTYLLLSKYFPTYQQLSIIIRTLKMYITLQTHSRSIKYTIGPVFLGINLIVVTRLLLYPTYLVTTY